MNRISTTFALLAVSALLGWLSSGPTAGQEEATSNCASPFPCADAEVAHYTAYRTSNVIQIDGALDEAAWDRVPRSPRFVDLISGDPTIHDTRAAVLWDDEYLYVGFWLEEPDVRGDITERDSQIWRNNDAEVFIAGKDAYYEFEVNSLGTIMEHLLVWKTAYDTGAYGDIKELKTDDPRYHLHYGIGFKNHPRGVRIGTYSWDLPGLKWAVAIDGSLNDIRDRDRGWTVEIAFPWQGLSVLTRGDNRALPPNDGDTWRIDFSRFNQYKAAAPAEDSGGWAWSTHRVWDAHVPECYLYIHFSVRDVSDVGR